MIVQPSNYENITLRSGKNLDYNAIAYFKKTLAKKIKEGYKIKGDLVIKDGEYIQELIKVKK